MTIFIRRFFGVNSAEHLGNLAKVMAPLEQASRFLNEQLLNLNKITHLA